MYAERLTKEELITNGISEITTDGRVFRTGQEVQPYTNSKGYLVLNLYDRDSEGNYIKIPFKRKALSCKNLINTYRFKSKTVGLHRAMWAWFYGEVPQGYVVDHINNSHINREDYHLDNLQLLTPKENLAKERPESTKEVKCKLNKPREYYETKLNQYLEAYESAKLKKDPKLAHKLRANISQTKARLRYYDNHIKENEMNSNKEIKCRLDLPRSWYESKLAELEAEPTTDSNRTAVYQMKCKLRYYDSHIEEANKLNEFKKDCQILSQWKQVFRENNNKKLWHQCCTIEKLVKEKGIEAWPVVEHALEVISKYFERK